MNLNKLSKNIYTYIKEKINWFIYSSTPYIDFCICSIYIYHNGTEFYVVAENPFNNGYIIPFIKI